jgi:hypothetical protein
LLINGVGLDETAQVFIFQGSDRATIDTVDSVQTAVLESRITASHIVDRTGPVDSEFRRRT